MSSLTILNCSKNFSFVAFLSENTLRRKVTWSGTNKYTKNIPNGVFFLTILSLCNVLAISYVELKFN